MKPPINRLNSSVILIIVCAVVLPHSSAAACLQQQVDPHAPIFSWLFPNPTNNNGYEEFVRAVDLIKNVEEIDSATEPGATLEFKRRILAMPACSTALSLIREGLAKPVKSPRKSIDENTLLPELSQFRKLARLLATEQYVDFADGRVDAAVESLRVGLSFGYRIQTDTIISGLVGIAVSTIVSHEFAAHFDQLSIYQCDDVLAFAKQLLEAETPGASIMHKEKAEALKILDRQRGDPAGLLGIFADTYTDDDLAGVAAFNALKTSLTGAPGSASPIIDAAEAELGALYDQAAANMLLPIFQRLPLILDKSSTPAATLCRLVAVDPQRVVDRYTTDQAKIRLLAVHMLIRRYKWDHNSLPGSLDELHAEDLVIDPFTGNTITYKRDGDRYTLTSAGPLKQDDVTGQATQARNPVTLR